MTSPEPQPTGGEATQSEFLVTTTLDKSGNYGSDTVDIADVPDAMLFQYVAQGDQRAAAELLARMAAAQQGAEEESS